MTKTRASLALTFEESITRLEKQGKEVEVNRDQDGTISSFSVADDNDRFMYFNGRTPDPFDVGRVYVKPDGRVVFNTPAMLWLRYKRVEAVTVYIGIEEKNNLIEVIFTPSARNDSGSHRVAQLKGIATVKVPALAGLSDWSDLAWVPDQKSLVAGF